MSHQRYSTFFRRLGSTLRSSSKKRKDGEVSASSLPPLETSNNTSDDDQRYSTSFRRLGSTVRSSSKKRKDGEVSTSSLPPPENPNNTSDDDRAAEAPFGLKVLVAGIDPNVDLVAVHGLDGHREDTWTADNGMSWLRDSLHQNIPNVRILTWGYDGRTYGSTPLSCQSFHDHALALITDLTAWRRKTNTRERAIIFVAHGAGGIIVKDALIHSNAANKSNLQHHNTIKASTCGVLFFGTPHQGVEGISWSQILLNTALVMTKRNEALLRELEEGSASLQKQLAQYNHISSDFETKFFYECYPAKGGDIIVPQDAAIVPGATNAEAYAINSDHEGLVKYKTVNDAGFRKVSLCISLVVDEAPAKALKNWEHQRLVAVVQENEGVQMTFKIPFALEYLRNPRFAGRESLLNALHAEVESNKASGQSKPIILHGTGGIGKSQVVVEYLYAHQKDHSSIFWINASTPGTVIIGFRLAAQRLIKEHAKLSLKSQPHYPTIAKSLGMVGVVDEAGLLSPAEVHNECIVDGMKLWFGKEDNRGWILVFDNVDDLEALNIETFMPCAGTGNIIMTSRRSDCAHFGVGLEVKEMSEEEGATLLLNIARLPASPGDDPIELKVTKELGSLPLALVQAGAFVAARHISLERYLEIYNESFSTALAKKQPRGVGTYGDRSVLTTWEISFKAIRETNRGAAELLSLCAFLFNEVQEKMLCRGEIATVMAGADDFALDESLGLLYTYSLAHPQSTPGRFYIHPVVHRWAQERLEHSERVEKVKEAFTLVASATKHPDRNETEHRRYERTILPHIDCVTQNAQKYLGRWGVAAVFPSLYHLVSVNNDWGRIVEAQWMASHAHEIALGAHGKDHEVTASAMGNLAATHVQLGQWDEAETLGLQVLEAMKRNNGPEHPDTLSAMVNLAATYTRQGRWDEAETLGLEALEAMKRNNGSEHPGTLSAMVNLAATYTKQGRWDEAETLGLEALEAMKRNNGSEHPDTLSAMGNLAATYTKQGRWDEAETLELQVLEARKRNSGPEHPGTLSAMGNLAATYTRQGRWDEAETLELQVLEVRKRNSGPEHPGTLSAMVNLAATYAIQGRWDEAETLELQVLEVRKRNSGPEHPGTLSAMVNLAATYAIRGRWDEAETLGLEALEARKRNNGPEHPDTLNVMRILAKISTQRRGRDFPDDPLAAMATAAEAYMRQNRPQEAEQLLEQVVKRREMALGLEHPDTLSAMTSLASTYCTQKRWDEAEHLQQKVVDERQRVLGSDHSDTLLAMVSLASVHWNHGWWEKAEALEQQVVDVRQRVLGIDHPDTLSAIGSLAVSYRMQGQYKEAEALHRQVMEATEKIRGSEHPVTMTAMANLASTYGNQERWEKAEELQKIIMDTRERQLGRNHPDTQRAIANLAGTYRKRGRHEEAKNLRAKPSQAISSYDPSTPDEMGDLVESYLLQGRTEDLPQLLLETVERRGSDDKVTIFLKAIVSKMYKDSGQYDEASILREQVIQTLQRMGRDPESLLKLAEMMSE